MNTISRVFSVAGALATLFLAAVAFGAPPVLDTTDLLVRLESSAGITIGNGGSVVGVLDWADQSALGGSQDVDDAGGFSRTPLFITEASPSLADAVRFNGAANNPNQLRDTADSNYDVATGSSLTWSLAFKPPSFDAVDTYVQTDVSGRRYAWSLGHANGKFWGEVRDEANNRYTSEISDATLGGLENDWMVLTAVYDGTANTFQLFLTDSVGTLHTGNQVTSATLHNGTHSLTTLGTNTDRNNGGAMDLGAMLIYQSALGTADRLAMEDYLFQVYVAPPGGTVIRVR